LRPLPILRTTLIVNLIVTITAMTLAYRALRRADESARLVIRSHRTLQASEETLRRAVDVETGARGFILTHNPLDLARFRGAHVTVIRSLDDLTTILSDDGRAAVAERVRVELTATLAHLDRLVQHATAGDGLEAADSDAARASMDALRAAVRSIRQSETDVLNARIQRVETADRRVNWLLIVMTGLATALLTLLVAVLVFVSRPKAWRP
jgi:methyl-accepting chemotaxis protein